MNPQYVHPEGALQETIARVWGDVLGVKNIGQDDDFFELGGNSLTAVQAVTVLSKELGIKVSVRQLFEGRTVNGLAALIAPQSSNNVVIDRVPSGVFAKFSALTQPHYTPEPSLTSLEHRPLMALIQMGCLPRLDAAAITYVTDDIWRALGPDPQSVVDHVLQGVPVLEGLLETPIGRIGTAIVPHLESELYTEKPALLQRIKEAAALLGALGARVISLTGLFPSATDYGLQLVTPNEPHHHGPLISTGHAATAAAVVLSLDRALELTNRSLSEERVGFLGLGSIGKSVAQLMLKVEKHPREIILCDVFQKLVDLENLAKDFRSVFGFQGEIKIVPSSKPLPASFYKASTIVGATNVGSILDVNLLHPGTIIVDDSGPYCFNEYDMMRRIMTSHDVIVTEAGRIRCPSSIRMTAYVPKRLRHVPLIENHTIKRDPLSITGCILSSALSATFKDLPVTLGPVRVEHSVLYYEHLVRMGFQGDDPNLRGQKLASEFVETFRKNFGR